MTIPREESEWQVERNETVAKPDEMNLLKDAMWTLKQTHCWSQSPESESKQRGLLCFGNLPNIFFLNVQNFKYLGGKFDDYMKDPTSMCCGRIRSGFSSLSYLL